MRCSDYVYRVVWVKSKVSSFRGSPFQFRKSSTVHPVTLTRASARRDSVVPTSRALTSQLFATDEVVASITGERHNSVDVGAGRVGMEMSGELVQRGTLTCEKREGGCKDGVKLVKCPDFRGKCIQSWVKRSSTVHAVTLTRASARRHSVVPSSRALTSQLFATNECVASVTGERHDGVDISAGRVGMEMSGELVQRGTLTCEEREGGCE